MDTIKKRKGIFGNKRLPTARKVFLICNAVFLILLSLTFVLPYVNILAKALNESKDTMLGGLTFLPREFTWDNFRVVVYNESTWRGFLISVLRVVFAAIISVAVNYMAAYALLRKGLRFKKLIVIYFTIPMFVNGGLISNYIIYSKLHLLDSFLVYILPNAFSFYYMVVIRTYLQGIPSSLLESARLDGANEFRILLSIMVPLSKPILATMVLFSAVGSWNDWTTTLYYIEDPRLYTLQYNLQLTIKEAETTQQLIAAALESGRPLGNIDMDVTGESIQAAQIIFTTLPIVCVYPFIQKYFMSGMMVGSVKE